MYRSLLCRVLVSSVAGGGSKESVNRVYIYVSSERSSMEKGKLGLGREHAEMCKANALIAPASF